MKGRGLTYEGKVCRELLRRFLAVRVGQWIQYADAIREGYAQPDCYVVLEKSVLVFEIKLTQCLAGELQIVELYRPLLELLYRKPVVGIMVCKNIVYEPVALIRRPEDLMDSVDPRIFTWHWLGR